MFMKYFLVLLFLLWCYYSFIMYYSLIMCNYRKSICLVPVGLEGQIHRNAARSIITPVMASKARFKCLTCRYLSRGFFWFWTNICQSAQSLEQTENFALLHLWPWTLRFLHEGTAWLNTAIWKLGQPATAKDTPCTWPRKHSCSLWKWLSKLDQLWDICTVIMNIFLMHWCMVSLS